MIGSTLTAQFATRPASVSVFASGLIVIVSAHGRFPPSTGAKSGGKGDNDHGHTIPRQCHATGSARPGRGWACYQNHRHVRPLPGAAALPGGFLSGAEPRHHPLHDLSGARTGAGAHGAWLFGAAAAVSAGGGLCP